MPRNDAIGSKAADRSTRNNAWEIVSRLAAAREAALEEIKQERRVPAAPSARVGNTATSSSNEIATIDPDQLARAVAEIEQASAALRRAEPTLEMGVASAPTRSRKYWSVWILIGCVWISATLVVAGATGAILYLFG
jgi:hypothetical protein